MEIICKYCDIQFNLILQCLLVIFSDANNLIRQINTLWKPDEIVSESKIVWKNGGRQYLSKIWQTMGPGEIYQY